MSKKESIEQKAEALILPVLEAEGIELVDTEYVKEAGTYYLRYYIDKPLGVTIGDCETVSRAVSDLLDRDDFISEAYILEVSSPGLGRPIKKERDYVRNLGKEIEIRLFKPLKDRKEWVGTLASYTEDSVTIRSEQEEVFIEKKNISLIREYVDFSKIQPKEEEF
ncbi:MAG: ribosome maturation factor RimP [Lachnospiraceae bacterium]|nr:ribosome maturation factor RimP [Lachnospiraceae bacterium]